MFESKKEIDKYVNGLLSKLSEKEFNLRAYSIARLYFNVGDYSNCQKYVELYLNEKHNNAAAHKLLGQAFHKLGLKEKALEQYNVSLDIDPTQTSLLLDICELLADDHEIFTKSGQVKYWCEKVEATYPKHPVTFRLKEKLLMSADPNPEAMITLLTTELSARPKDVTLHARLLKHYLHSNRIIEAFNHSLNVEFGENSFSNNEAWYETISEILKHNSLNTNDWKYQLLLLSVKEHLCILSLTETPNGTSKGLVECNELLHHYDQAVQVVAKGGAPTGHAEFHSALLQHHRGQLVFHTATYLLKKAKKDQLNWCDAKKLAAPLMLMSWHIIPLNMKVNWLSHAPEIQKTAAQRWYLEATCRCSQSGHYLLANVKDKNQFLDDVAQLCSSKDWKDKLYEKIFTIKDHLAKKRTSHIVSDAFNNPTLRLPRKIDVEAYDINAQRSFPSSLHHLVWILLNYENFADFNCTLFDMLSPKSNNAQNCGPETLSKLDVHSFLFCAALTSKQNVLQGYAYTAPDKPVVLPANITDLLCPSAQMKWWDCAYKFSQNLLGSELTDIRSTLSRGIEVVRCIDNHGLDPELLCKLGKIFSEIAKKTKSVDEKNHLEVRAALYYSSAIPLLEKLINKLSIRIPDRRLFSYTHKELNPKDLSKLIEECKIYVAENYMKDSEYNKAVDLLLNLKSPEAYFHLSESYKKMAEEEYNVCKDIANSETRSKYATLLAKSKNFAYKTLDRLKEIHEDKKHNLFIETQQLIEDIESHLNRLDPEISGTLNNDSDGKYSSDENGSLPGNENFPMHMNSHFRKLSSTPKHSAKTNVTNYQTAVDSQVFDTSHIDHKYLDHIDNQIRKLQNRDTSVNSFIEQTRNWFDENRDLGKIIGTINSNIQNTTDQFKLLKISVDQVKDQINECRNECKDVGDLKKQIAELKKEVNKLKKASSDQGIDESDLYNLEDESSSNFSTPFSFNPAQVMPSLNQRLVPPPFPMPPNPYQLYGQNLYNFYNQFSQLSQAPGASQLFDPSRPVHFPPVFSGAEQMYADISQLLPGPPTIAPVPSIPVPPVPMAAPPLVPPAPLVPPVPMPSHQPPPPPLQVPKSVTQPKDNSLPFNVVITSSDPLPTCTTGPQPVLSVTIPPKHIKGTPHNYQIEMPNASEFGNSGQAATMPKSVPNWNQPISFKTTQASTPTTNTLSSHNFSLFDTSKANSTLDNSNTVVDGFLGQDKSPNTSINKSRTLSERSNTSVEYDPCPDFKPIVPLPAEVKVTTGEENETAIFSARAKLYRFTDKQWKERGVGTIKLLKHNVTGKVRVLMRREQIHKICANHIITPEMEIQPMKNESKAYFWVANDFADETVVLEKFSIRFKTAEIAKEFYEMFQKARQDSKLSQTNTPKSEKKSETVSFAQPQSNTQVKENISTQHTATTITSSNKTVVGGFTFTSVPNFKDVKDKVSEPKPAEVESNKANPFSALSFKSNTTGSPFNNLLNLTTTANTTTASSPNPKLDTSSNLNTSDNVEEFEPNVEFKPVVPLPALVETKTGEEDEITLFEHRAKLLRFVAASKEWKERGLGNMKLLVRKDNPQKVRLLMRREQVMKVCCNHALTKEMVFEKMPNMDKAVTWCAKDFSEGELVPETFCLRFKNVQICDDFLKAVKAALSKLTDETKAAKEEQNAAKQIVSQKEAGFGDKFKPKAGSWHCDSCYTNNLESFLKCACCDQPKPQDKTAPQNSAVATPSSGWGDKFKPKAGTWECKECFVRNEANADSCNACNSPKDPTAKKDAPKTIFGSSQKFSFGIPSQTAATVEQQAQKTATPVPTAPTGWGDKFKPKEGTWECKQCYIRNEGGTESCSACNSPKDPNAVKKETNSIFSVDSPKFTFGIPAASNTAAVEVKKAPEPISMFDGKAAQAFSFGIPTANIGSPFGTNKSLDATKVIFADPTKPEDTSKALNFSIKQNNDSTVTIKPALLPTPQKDFSSPFGSKEAGKFEFVFKPKTPPKDKSPMKSPKAEMGNESDDNEYASEDEGHHIHFNPVIPLPDKIEVVTGEENEEELYAHRAKLFRLLNGEWKERGLGVVKVLKHKETGKLRVVMRREQVLKICLNHALTADISYRPKDEKTWIFAANDYSEGELNLEKFCLRFKTKEIALDFKNSVDKARGISVETVTKKEDNDDVVFVSELQATSEEKQKAKELMLPENFFTYKSKESCQGCRGCDEEDKKSHVAKEDSPSAVTPVKSTASSLQSPASSMFTTPASSIFTTPANSNKSENTSSIFRTPLESIGSNTSSIWSLSSSEADSTLTGSANNKENTLLSKPSIFGGTPLNKSIFSTPVGKFCGSETPVPSKSSILAPPKLATVIPPKEEPVADPKSVFSMAQTKLNCGGQNSAEKQTATATTTSNTVSAPLFSNLSSASSNNKSIFSAPDNPKPEVKSIFGGAEPKTESIFGTAIQGSLFGPSSNNQSGSIFGSTGGSIFGSSSGTAFGANRSIFGNASQTGPIWNIGANAEKKSEDASKSSEAGKNIFTSKVNELKKEESGAKKESLFSNDTGLSFATLSSSEPVFATQKKNDFQWEGAGQQLFVAGSKAQGADKGNKSKDESVGVEEGEGEAGGDDEYDPHYEPIVPLPDKIVVTTGEEDEEKIFGERCKLFRYDDKTREWKERGIGEMKLLYHPERNTYRLLLRREQVHKAVLNMLLFMDMDLLPMKNSDRAWTWAGRNYAETPAGEQETLAVKFKSVDLATSFRDKVVECVRKLQAAAAQAVRDGKANKDGEAYQSVAPLRLPKHLENNARVDLAMSSFVSQIANEAGAGAGGGGEGKQNGDAAEGKAEAKAVHFEQSQGEEGDHADDEEEGYYEQNYGEYEDYANYYNEEDDSALYYECEGEVQVQQGDEVVNSCPEAHVQVLFEQDAPKILITDPATGEILADMLVDTDTEFQITGESCTWSGTDYTSNEPVDKTVSVNFGDSESAMNFYDSCEGVKSTLYADQEA